MPLNLSQHLASQTFSFSICSKAGRKQIFADQICYIEYTSIKIKKRAEEIESKPTKKLTVFSVTIALQGFTSSILLYSFICH